MRTVYKYEVGQQHYIPEGFQPLFVDTDPRGIICVWMEVNTEDHNALVELAVYGTGHKVPYNSEYCGSFMQPPFVWHVFAEFQN